MLFSFDEAPLQHFFMATPLLPSTSFSCKARKRRGLTPPTLFSPVEIRRETEERGEGEWGEREERREGIPEGDLALFQLALMHSRIQSLIVNIYSNNDII
jgi:hypothetical protein